MIDDLLGGAEDPVDRPLSRTNGQTVSTGFNSGERGGKGRSVMVSGPFSLVETGQPAWSSSSTACAPGATAGLISSNGAAMAFVLQEGRTRPAPLPFFGQMAPKMEAQAVRGSCGAEGCVPRRAQRRVPLVRRPDPGLVMPPQLDRGAVPQTRLDRLPFGGQALLNASLSRSFWV